MSVDLEAVIASSIEDAVTPADPDTSTEGALESSAEGLEASPNDAGAEADPDSLEVTSPAAKGALAPGEAIDQKLGIQPKIGERENRIPYSRVKKIVEKAEREAITPLTTKLAELEPRVAQYEQRLQQVAQFEQVMVNDPQKFLGMLSQIPAYAGFFKQLEAFATGAAAPQQAAQQPAPDAEMPQPDEALPDGSRVYSMEGLQKLLDWRDARVRSSIETQLEQKISSRYAPIEQEFNTQRQIQALVPQVQAQIEEAGKWPLFKDSEAEIISHLQANPKAGLQEAYMAVVLPKLVTDRNSMRQSLLQEIGKAKPVVSAPVSQSRGTPKAGPRSMEDVIADSIKGLA